jgi:hypothetical protein
VRISTDRDKPFISEDGSLAGRIVASWYASQAGVRDQAMFRNSIVDVSEFWENVEAIGGSVEFFDYRLVYEG